MYTMILMATLNGGMVAPECHKRHGCHGCHSSHSCHGGYGCGGDSYGCGGGYGGGGYSCGGAYDSAPVGCYQGAPYQGAPMPGGPRGPEKVGAPEPKKTTENVLRNSTLVVQVPADASLYVNGVATTTTGSAVRTFYTPPLENGYDYSYSVKAQVNRDGQTRTVTREIVFRPGTVSRIDLTDFESANSTAQVGR